MKRRDFVYLQKKNEGALIFTFEYLTWKQTREKMRDGWEIVTGETDVSR
jgi:hypothetical protein